MSDHKENRFQSIIESMMDNAQAVLSTKTVVGEPIKVDDTIIIPLSDVTIGCAAGSNNASEKDAGLGGLSAKISPTAVLVIRDKVTKVVSIKDQNTVNKLLEMVPEPGKAERDDEKQKEKMAALKASYDHLCKMRDEIVSLGIVPPVAEWKSLNPNL